MGIPGRKYLSMFYNEDINNFLAATYAVLLKYISGPALIAVFIKISVQVKNNKATIVGILCSLISGLGMAYITKGWIDDFFATEGMRTICIAFVAILSDRIAEYFIFHFNINAFLDGIFELAKKVSGK
jgi:hypothetical protein